MDIMPTQVYEHDSFEATQRVTFDSQQNESQEVGILRIDEVSYIIKKGTNKIGRHPNCNVVLNNDTVSGHHAEIEAGVVSGTAFISDTNSTNGTKLKSVSLKPGRAYQLKDGDTIEFGKVNAIYEIPSECLVLNTPLIVKPKQRNLTVIPSIPDSFTEDLLDKEKNDSLIPSSQEGEDNIFRNPSLLCKTYNVRKNIGISVQNETASKDYSKDIQKAMRSENKIIDNLDNLESQGIESDIHNAETQLNHLVTCKIEKNKDTCDMETHFKECSSDTENKQLDVSEMETQVNDWITRSSNSIYEKETQLDLIDSSRGESASRQQEYSDIHDMETQINLFDNDNTKETLQDGNKETAKDIDEDIYVFETQENVEEQRNPIAKENSKIIVESDDEDVKEVAENNTETQTSKSFATITNEDAKNSDLRESSPISSSEKVMIVNSPLKNKTSPGKRLPLRFNMCISDSDSDSVGEEKSSKKSPQDALKLSVNMDVSEGISLKKDDLTSINVDETAKASTSKGNNEGNQRNSDNELSGESDDLFEVATQQNNIINQGTQSKISNSLSQTITRQDDDAIFYATTQIVSTTKEIVEKIDVAKSDSIENSENSVADKSIGAVSIETKITSTSNGGICQLNSVEKNKVSKNCNDCTGDERGVANEEGSQITEDKNESLNSDYHMQPTQLLQFSDVQDNSEEEHGASVEDLEYELAPTQLLCVLESQRQEKSPSPKNVSSNSKKTDTRKTNLNDSVEKNLNDMFETVTEEVYQPPQISTQYLNDALELSETEIETPNDNLATKGNVDENVQKNSVASGSIHQDCFDEPSKCLTAKNHQAMDQEDYFKNIRSDGKHSSFIHSQKTDEIEVISSEIDRNVKPCTSSTQKKMKFDLESTQPNSDVPNTSSNEVMKNSKPKRRRKIKKGTGLESDSQYSGESDICSQLSGTSLELNTETKKLTVASASISKNVKVPEESSKNVKNSVGPDTSAKLNINTIPEVDSQESYFVNFKFNRKCKNIIEDEPSDPIVLTEVKKSSFTEISLTSRVPVHGTDLKTDIDVDQIANCTEETSGHEEEANSASFTNLFRKVEYSLPKIDDDILADLPAVKILGTNSNPASPSALSAISESEYDFECLSPVRKNNGYHVLVKENDENNEPVYALEKDFDSSSCHNSPLNKLMKMKDSIELLLSGNATNDMNYKNLNKLADELLSVEPVYGSKRSKTASKSYSMEESFISLKNKSLYNRSYSVMIEKLKNNEKTTPQFKKPIAEADSHIFQIPKAAPISKRGRRKTTNNDVVNKIVSIPKEHEKRKSRTTVQDIEGPKANESVEKPGINKRKRESSKSKLSPSSTQMLTEVIISSPRSRRSKRQKVNESQENSQNSTMRIPIKANKPAIRSKRQSNQDIQQAEQESKNTAGKGSQIRHSARIKGKKEVSQNQSIIITKKPEIVPAKRRKVEETEKLSTVIRRSARSDKTTSESILNYFPSGTPISSTSQSKNKSSRDNTIDVISGSNELVKKTSSSFSTMSSCSTFGEGLIVTSTPSRTRMSTSKLNFNSSSQIKHKILFTGIQDNEFNKILKELGAVKSEDPRKCTVLVTDKIRRTFKFLCALAASVPIVSINWLHDSQTAGTFLDYDNYILKDPAMEAKFGFKLRKSLEISRQKKLLDGYIVILTSNIPTPPITELKNMITACGGKALIRPPTPWSQKSVIISCEKDIDHAKKLLTKAPNNVTIQSTEFLLTGILKQELNFVKTRLV
ncbi:serine-rich adhesin for platelets-like isoform X2 [Prorops nasuta]|uniref:serine-rich adhesin for platelets-like isoform X2 n=1 Tax=Prorops nasuta TaxID=863751 RepID=UPI0034D01799